MKVALWAEIRRLYEVERLSQRAISARLRCSRHTVAKALAQATPPSESAHAPGGSALAPYYERIQALLRQSPELSAVRVWEEIRRGADGYQGSVITVRRYVRQLRRRRARVYQEVAHEPGQAMQVDWGDCGSLVIGSTRRKVSVFAAVLCYSRLCYIEFSLSQRKAEFYRAIAHALKFYQGCPRKIVFDNLKAAVLNGHGRHASLHPEFSALCGHFCLEPIACARRDPESKGMVESLVRYVKQNALAGREEQLQSWEDYQTLAVQWRDEVANVRLHQRTGQRPVDRFEEERSLLRPLPAGPLDTDEIVSAVVTPHARVHFDGNRYSTPATVARQAVVIRASSDQVRVLHQGQEVACHQRCYERGRLIVLAEHYLEAVSRRQRPGLSQLEQAFQSLGPVAATFLVKLQARPIKTASHLRRLLSLARLYGRAEVLAALELAHQFKTYDAAYVEVLLHQRRRQQDLPSPISLRPRRPELIDEIELDEPDPSIYDQLLDDPDDEDDEEDSHGPA